jgi:plastocyanin
MRRTLLILAMTGGLAACGGKGSSSPTAPSPSGTGSTAAIAIQGDGYGSGTFTPPQIEVTRGTTVVWSNRDQTTHTVTSDTGLFSSGSVDGGSGFSQAFSTPGTYAYHCTLHPNMTGTVVVK